MFDWDDQELANIIWGEGREADDHIVPYSEDIEKKVLSDYRDDDQKTLIDEDSKSVAAAKKPLDSKLIIDDCKRDDNVGLSTSGAVINSEVDIPSLVVSKTHDGDLVKGGGQLDIDHQTSRNHHEEKDLGDLVSNSWASIGSFDDLDRIFSNDELEGTTSLGSTDELWSSSKDLISGAAKSSPVALSSTNWEFGALGNTSANIEINSDYLHNNNPSAITVFNKADCISPFSRPSVRGHVEQEEYAVGSLGLIEEKIGLGNNLKTTIDSHIASESIASPNKSIDKELWSKTRSKHEQATDRMTDSRLMGDVYDTWPSSAASAPHFGYQCAPATAQNYPASVSGQQQLSQEYRHLPYQNFSTPYGSPYAYVDFTNQHRAMRMLKPTEDGHQSLLSHPESKPSDLISLSKFSETTKEPTKMTPQEKIEKLRRRQQMRALLAIQKQQQRLGHQVSSGDLPHPHKSCQKDQVQHKIKSDLEADEILSFLPCYEPGSPNKGDNSSTISNIEDFAVEETVLYQLQDIISSLDMKIRLCIRDSLYRLARSATQRHYANDTSSAKRSISHELDIAKEEISSHDRFIGNEKVETETNHIDRTVAHLLFHRPLKLLVRHTDTPDSSTSTKVSTEQETATPSSLSVGMFAKSSENEYNLSPRRSKSPPIYVDSREEDTSNDISRKEMKLGRQMKQMTAEHTD